VNIGAVILAAGASTRLGEPKQLLRDRAGEALIHKVAREAMSAGANPVVVVLGANAERVREAVSDLQVQTVVNTNWPEGLSSSIREGVRVLAAEQVAPVDAVLLLTCDMPSVGIPHLTALLQAAGEGSTRVASSYDYTRGIPAIVPRAEFVLLEGLTGDKGAKELLKRQDTTVVRLANGAFDLDTPENVAAWRASE